MFFCGWLTLVLVCCFVYVGLFGLFLDSANCLRLLYFSLLEVVPVVLVVFLIVLVCFGVLTDDLNLGLVVYVLLRLWIGLTLCFKLLGLCFPCVLWFGV